MCTFYNVGLNWISLLGYLNNIIAAGPCCRASPGEGRPWRFKMSLGSISRGAMPVAIYRMLPGKDLQ